MARRRDIAIAQADAGLAGLLDALGSTLGVVTVAHPSFDERGARRLAEAAAEHPAAVILAGRTRAKAALDAPALLASPAPLGPVAVRADRWQTLAAPDLRPLADLCDPVAERNALWLLAAAVLAAGGTLAIEPTARPRRIERHHDDADRLTDEGRAWLVRAAAGLAGGAILTAPARSAILSGPADAP